MVVWWFAGWLAFAAPTWATPPSVEPAPDISSTDRAAIEAVISSQIAAFQRDDANAAFALASPGIRARFGSADRFLDIVRDGYRPVYRPRSFAFGDTVRVPEQPAQIVHVVGPDGREVTALYLLEKQPDGAWLTAGCLLLDPGLAVPNT